MRKLVFQQFISLDGFAADKDGTTKFFETEEIAEDSDKDLLTEMDRFDTILLGANTYRMFVDFWPEADVKEQMVADKLNSIPKIVFSSTLNDAPWGRWQPAKIESGDVVEAIQKLKSQPGKDMVLWGSISLSQAIIKANLVDEFQFRIVPVLLGSGTPQFGGRDQLQLKLIASKAYPSGVLLTHYVPA